jgi:hypothetical protein
VNLPEKTPPLPRTLMLACLVLLLASCGREIVRTQTVEVPVPTPVALDSRLTTLPPEPSAPGMQCVDAALQPTVCNEDAMSYLDTVRAWGRKLYNQLREIAELQPKTSTP